LDRASVVWTLAFGYVVYAAIGDIPALAGYALFSITVSSLLFVVLYLVHSYASLGIKAATKYLVVSSVVGYLFEFLFINTGWLGRYVYTADLSPFLGPIPLFIPFLWASLSYFCMVAADSYAVSALLMVLLDVSFDPRFSVTLWRWVPPGQYFGVPVANFVGWFVTAAAIYVVFYLTTRRKAQSTGRAIAFYFLIGLFNGALPDMVLGLYEAGVISLVLFLIATALIYFNAHKIAERRPASQGSFP
jgi:uncharacterized membrane protein